MMEKKKINFIGGLIVLLLTSQLSGCASWFSGKDNSEKPAPLVEFKQTAVLKPLWRESAGSAGDYVFTPANMKGSVYAASHDGYLSRYDADSGKQSWRVETGKKLSGGVGAGDGMVFVGTGKGEVLSYSDDGKLLWQSQLSSEVLSAPQTEDGVVVIRTGDGKIFGLDAKDGKRKWVYQRATPALTVRSNVGVVVTHGAVFAGFAGGKLVGLNLINGNVGWEATVALPKGATELERIADITSLPVVDTREVCAVAYQGRVACFETQSGNPIWARDISSIAGMAMDQRNVYISDDKGAVVALDKTSGSSVWKQDKLFARKLSAPVVRRGYVVVGDVEGYVHLMLIEDGSFAARAATDGSSIGSQPVALENGFVVQTRSGGLHAFTIQ
ncbi:outer membrane protein assembly factor BamB [Sulfurirhabdus autotrophica]|uniref:Outer membrane protein assembly factor BamB n=1 Tax=Sulfurirhabdus autotrophica TaxID=1706046 RepID=A0A4R3Y6E4_9PROT|nr:outer membrane protein assembly factor BamB [Sulfurirhabdus autotrophica]TCV87396.1 Beta-barrel assembly machine subunit BamB [Sulfurirhabdus autotrophica]